MTDCENKLHELRKYIPFLEKVIEKLIKDDKRGSEEFVKIEALLNIVSNKDKKFKIQTLEKCENVLAKLHTRWERITVDNDKTKIKTNKPSTPSSPSPQEKFEDLSTINKSVKIIPTERKDNMQQNYGRNSSTSNDTFRSDSRDDRELYRRRSPASRHHSYQRSDLLHSNFDESYRAHRYDWNYNKPHRYERPQLPNVTDIFGPRARPTSHTLVSSDFSRPGSSIAPSIFGERNNSPVSHSLISNERNDLTRSNYSGPSIFNRLGEKFDITTPNSYENLRVHVRNDKIHKTISTPIADVLKSPPLSVNDINDLMNESNDKNKKNQSKEFKKVIPEESDDWKSLRDLELARKKLNSIDVSKDVIPRKTVSPVLKIPEFDENVKQFQNKLNLAADTVESSKTEQSSKDIDKIRPQDKTELPTIESPNRNDPNCIRLAYKYNPHRRMSQMSDVTPYQEDQHRSQQDPRLQQGPRSLQQPHPQPHPKDPRSLQEPLVQREFRSFQEPHTQQGFRSEQDFRPHNTLPNINRSDPRLKAHRNDPRLEPKPQPIRSLLDIAVPNPFKEVESQNNSHSKSSTIISHVPVASLPTTTSQNLNISSPTSPPAANSIESAITLGKFRPTLNDQVERMKYLESKKNKQQDQQQPQTYKEHREAKLESERRKMERRSQLETTIDDKLDTLQSTSQPKTVLDVMYRNSDWKGELAHVPLKFKIPKLNKVDKSNEQEKSTKIITEKNNEKTSSDENKEENWDDIDAYSSEKKTNEINFKHTGEVKHNKMCESKKKQLSHKNRILDDSSSDDETADKKEGNNSKQNWDDIDVHTSERKTHDISLEHEKVTKTLQGEKKHVLRKNRSLSVVNYDSDINNTDKVSNKKKVITKSGDDYDVNEKNTQSKKCLTERKAHKDQTNENKHESHTKYVNEDENCVTIAKTKIVTDNQATLHSDEQENNQKPKRFNKRLCSMLNEDILQSKQDFDKTSSYSTSDHEMISSNPPMKTIDGDEPTKKTCQKIRQRRKTLPTYVYIEVSDDEKNEDNTKISQKNIVEGKRERKSRISVPESSPIDLSLKNVKKPKLKSKTKSAISSEIISTEQDTTTTVESEQNINQTNSPDNHQICVISSTTNELNPVTNSSSEDVLKTKITSAIAVEEPTTTISDEAIKVSESGCEKHVKETSSENSVIASSSEFKNNLQSKEASIQNEPVDNEPTTSSKSECLNTSITVSEESKTIVDEPITSSQPDNNEDLITKEIPEQNSSDKTTNPVPEEDKMLSKEINVDEPKICQDKSSTYQSCQIENNKTSNFEDNEKEVTTKADEATISSNIENNSGELPTIHNSTTESTTVTKPEFSSKSKNIEEHLEIKSISETSTSNEPTTSKSNNNEKEENIKQQQNRSEMSLANLLNPSLLNQENILELLEQVLPKEKFLNVKKVLDDRAVEQEKEQNEKGKEQNEQGKEQNEQGKKQNERGKEQNEQEKEQHEHEEEKDQGKAQNKKQKTNKKSKNTLTSAATTTAKKNELDRLNEAIRDMYDGTAILYASGKRACTEKKQKDIVTSTNSVTAASSTKAKKMTAKKSTSKSQKTKPATITKKPSDKIVKHPETLNDIKIKIKPVKVAVKKFYFDKLKKTSNVEKSLTSLIESSISKFEENEFLEKCETSSTTSTTSIKKKTDKPCPKSKKQFYVISDNEDENNQEDHEIDKNLPIIETEKSSIKDKSIKKKKKKSIVTKSSEKEEKVAKVKGKTNGTKKIIHSPNDIKNIDQNMHSKSIYAQKCVLCGCNNGKPNHYVNDHKNSEVYVSRLAPDTLLALKQNEDCLAQTTIRKNIRYYEYQCPFCDNIQSLTKRLWFNHIGMHTGEHAYQCSLCNRKFSALPSLSLHKKSRCHDAETINLRHLNEENKQVVLAYICDLCNYIQLKEENIEKHLQSQHEITDENAIKRSMSNVILMKFAKSARAPRSKNKTIDNSNKLQTKDEKNKNIDAFLPKENTDFNLDSNLLKYMNDISFDTSNLSQKNHLSPSSIVDQLSMKINYCKNSVEVNVDDENDNKEPLADSLFSDIKVEDKMRQKLEPEISLEIDEQKIETSDTDEVIELLDEDGLSEIPSNQPSLTEETIDLSKDDDANQKSQAQVIEKEKDPLKITEPVLTAMGLADILIKPRTTLLQHRRMSVAICPRSTENITSTSNNLMSRRMSVAERLSERLRTENLTSTTDNNNLSLQNEDSTCSSSKTSTRSDQYPVDMDDLLENPLIIDETTEIEDSNITNQEVGGSEPILNPNTTNQLSNEDDDENDDDCWDDIEQITLENIGLDKSSKNKSMLATVSRLYTTISPSKKNQQQLRTLEDKSPKASIVESGISLPKCTKALVFTGVIGNLTNTPIVTTIAEPKSNSLSTEKVVSSTEVFPIITTPNTICTNEETNKSYEKELNQNTEHLDDDIIEIINLTPQQSNIVNRICNIGYSKTENDIKYRCLLEGCSFLYSSLPAGLTDHFKLEHVYSKWDGYCYLCSKKVASGVNMPMEKEIQHMVDVHLTQTHTNITTDSNPQNRIKVRRFSGDRLSSSTNIETDSIDKSSENVTTVQSNTAKVVIKFPNRKTPTIQPIPEILDVVNFNNDKSLNQYNLTPWMKNVQCIKSEEIVKICLQQETLTRFYKCMGKNCFYTTNLAKEMISHLANSSNLQDHIGTNKQSLLQCPYCETIALYDDVYMIHMKLHEKDIYQCSYCFYRSCSVHNIMTHLQNYHKNQNELCYQCSGQKRIEKPTDVKMLQIKQYQYVRQINCNDCSKCFHCINRYIKHLESHNYISYFICAFCKNQIRKREYENHLQEDHNVGPFQCIYCFFACRQIEIMKNHLSDKHASELVYCCSRNSFYCQDDNVEVENIDSYTKLINIENLFTTKQLKIIKIDDNAPVKVIQNDLLNSSDHNVMASINTGLGKSSNDSCKVTSAVTINSPKNTTSTNSSSENILLSNQLDSQPTTSNIMIPKLMDSQQSSSNYQQQQLQQKQSNDNNDDDERGRELMERIEKAVKELTKATGLNGEELYKCAIPGCNVSTEDAATFGSHLHKHSTTEFRCYHCRKNHKSVVELKFHIKTHGIHRFFCYFCSYASAIPTDVSKHMETLHSKTIITTYPLISGKKDVSKDFFVICPSNLPVTEVIKFGEHKIRVAENRKDLEKRYFKPDEIEKLPRPSILSNEVYCAICNYKTKIQKNMQRHLNDHKNSLIVANVDPVNPAPCLNSNEKHFDKMENLALSSNLGKYSTKNKQSYAPSTSASDVNVEVKLPNYVAESKRYKCGAANCVYMSVNEDMFKHHLSTLHISEKLYTCPHCDEVICKRGLSVDKIMQHLKYHVVKLFKCCNCKYFHHNKYVIERHINENHQTGDFSYICFDREDENRIKKTIIKITKTNTTTKSELNFKWECCICKKKTVTYQQVISHANKSHNVKSRYLCVHCNYGANVVKAIMDHIDTKHPTKTRETRIMYCKISEKQIVEKPQNDTTPLWRRDPSGVKSIRGILIEEEQVPNDLISRRKSEDSNDTDNDYFLETLNNRSIPGPSNATIISGKSATQTLSSIASKTSTITAQSILETPIASQKRKLSQSHEQVLLDPLNQKFYQLMFICQRCSFLGKTPLELEKHVATFDHLSLFMSLDKGLFFICVKCNHKEKTFEDLLGHWKQSHHSDKLINGEVISAPDTPFWFKISTIVRCARCPFTGNICDATRHHNVQHSEMSLAFIDIKKPNECSQCIFTYDNNLNTLSQHFMKDHKNLRHPFKPIEIDILEILLKIGRIQRYIHCLICCAIFIDSTAYKEHHAALHKNLSKLKFELIENQILYRCPSCEYTKKQENDIIAHLKNHIEPILRTCCKCNIKFQKQELLELHYQRFHPDHDLKFNKIIYIQNTGKFHDKLRIIFPNGFVVEKCQIDKICNEDILSLLRNNKTGKNNEPLNTSSISYEAFIPQNDSIPGSSLSSNLLEDPLLKPMREKDEVCPKKKKRIEFNYDNESKTKSPFSMKSKKIDKRRKSVAVFDHTLEDPLLKPMKEVSETCFNNEPKMKAKKIDGRRKSFAVFNHVLDDPLLKPMREINESCFNNATKMKAKKIDGRRKSFAFFNQRNLNDIDDDDDYDSDDKCKDRDWTPYSGNKKVKKRKIDNDELIIIDDKSNQHGELQKDKLEPYSFYGCKPEIDDLSKIYTTMTWCGRTNVRVSCEQFANFSDINPKLELIPIEHHFIQASDNNSSVFNCNTDECNDEPVLSKKRKISHENISDYIDLSSDCDNTTTFESIEEADN